MKSDKVLSKKEQIKVLEQHIINHSFILDALMNTLIENDICTFEDIQKQIQQNVNVVETKLKTKDSKPDEDVPVMSYYGPMGEA